MGWNHHLVFLGGVNVLMIISRERVHIPPNGKKGQSTTQKRRLVGDILVPQEGTVLRMVFVWILFCSLDFGWNDFVRSLSFLSHVIPFSFQNHHWSGGFMHTFYNYVYIYLLLLFFVQGFISCTSRMGFFFCGYLRTCDSHQTGKKTLCRFQSLARQRNNQLGVTWRFIQSNLRIESWES